MTMAHLLPKTIRNLLRKFLRFLESVWLAGSDVFCPCCQANWRQFAPGGVNKRVSARCPRCGALERHRLFALYFQARKKILPPGGKILHIAPEWPIERLFYARDDAQYIRGDLHPQCGEQLMDVCALPFRNNELDLVVATHVLEHVTNDALAMREIYRVLRPGGVAILLS
jgi:SAM-dependent methyltransferase